MKSLVTSSATTRQPGSRHGRQKSGDADMALGPGACAHPEKLLGAFRLTVASSPRSTWSAGSVTDRVGADPRAGRDGVIDTNYQGKVDAAIKVIEKHNFVFVHIEAPDECAQWQGPVEGGSDRSVRRKNRCPIWRALEKRGEPYRLLICTDIGPPCASADTPANRSDGEVDGPIGQIRAEGRFDEFVHGGKADIKVYDWMRELLKKKNTGERE